MLKSRDGTRIACDQAGNGPSLVVVDGAFTTRASESKAQLVQALAPHFTVLTFDRRGRGDSGDTHPYAVQREIEDIEAVIDSVGSSAHLYGHSSGGCLALEAARALGTKVKKLAVYEAPYNDDPAAQRAWGEYIRQLNEALAEGRRGDAAALFMRYVGAPAEQVEGMRKAPFWPGIEALAPTLAYDHTYIMGATAAVPRDMLAGVQAPTLALSGDAGHPFMPETARAISRAVPNGALKILAGQTHEVQAAALAPALIEFLAA